MNSVILVGRLARDPALKYIPGSGTAVAKFALAVDKGLFGDLKKEAESQGKPTADFIKIVVFGKQGENCSVYLQKGSLVAVRGSIVTGSYKDKNGTNIPTFEIYTDKVEFLEYGNKRAETSEKGERQNAHSYSDQFSFGGADFSFSDAEDDDDVPF